MSALNDMVALLGIDKDAQISRLKTITRMTESRLKVLISISDDNDVPDELEYIVTEVSISRFNRIGSEGLASHSVEGETMSWSENDFAPYLDDIQAYLDAQDNPSSNRGRVKFL